MDPADTRTKIFGESILPRAPGDASTKAYLVNKYLGGGENAGSRRKRSAKRHRSKKATLLLSMKRIWAGMQQKSKKSNRKDSKVRQMYNSWPKQPQTAQECFAGAQTGWQTIREANVDQDGEYEELTGSNKKIRRKRMRNLPLIVEDRRKSNNVERAEGWAIDKVRDP